MAFLGFVTRQLRYYSMRAKYEGGVAEPKHRPKLEKKDWTRYVEYRSERKSTGFLACTADGVDGVTFVPSSISIKRWTIKAKAELGEDASGTDIAKKLSQIRDAKLPEFVSFYKALTSGTAQSFAALPKPVKDFETFKKRIESFHFLSALPETEQRPDMKHSCSCPAYQNTGNCKHSVKKGIDDRVIEDETKKSIEKKHRRGRPKKNNDGALVVEQHQYIGDSSDEDTYRRDPPSSSM
mmetsp:Transcript_15630/g.33814  ORF Transcript_15630/g.33814 Transcript_15630/m.33814 type:complete len:238 (-) Transcript_15630:4-717(-)